jgi:hypothetical protein
LSISGRRILLASVIKPRRKSRRASESRFFTAYDPETGKQIAATDPVAVNSDKVFRCAGCLRHGKETEMEHVAGKPVPFFRKKSRKEHHPSCPYKNLQSFVNQMAEEFSIPVSRPGNKAALLPASSHSVTRQDPNERIKSRPDQHQTAWMRFMQRVLSEVELHCIREQSSFLPASEHQPPPVRTDLIGYVSDAAKLFQSSGGNRQVLLVGRVEKIAFSGDRYLIHLSDGNCRRLGISCQLSVSRFLYGDRTASSLHGKWVAACGILRKRHVQHYRMEILAFPEQLAILDPSLPELPAPQPQLKYIRQKFARVAESAGAAPVPDTFFRSWFGYLAEEQETRHTDLCRDLEKELRLVENQIAILKQQWRKNQDDCRVLKQHQEELERKWPRFILKLSRSFPVLHRLGFRPLREWGKNAEELNRLTILIKKMHEKWLELQWKRDKVRERLAHGEQVLRQLRQLAEMEQAAKQFPPDTLLFSLPDGPDQVRIAACSVRSGDEGKVLIEWTIRPFQLHEGFHIPLDDPPVRTGRTEIHLADFDRMAKEGWETIIRS